MQGKQINLVCNPQFYEPSKKGIKTHNVSINKYEKELSLERD